MKRRRAGVPVVLFASIAAAVAPSPGRAQEAKPAPRESDGAAAQRLVRWLELPERRSEAWRALVQLRAAAAPPLALVLQDPRPDVAVRAAWILGLLGPDGEMALPALQRGSKRSEPTVVSACRQAIARITFRGTLLTDYASSTVVHLDAKGEEVRRIEGLSSPWFTDLAGGGNLVVSEYGGNRVREIDAEGNEVWAFAELSNPYQCQRLPDGNTLIADAGHDRVVEVDRTGSVVWEKRGLKRPVAAERLPDGHVLITEQTGGRVIEFDEQDRVVLTVEGLERPQRAQRLPDGTTLIAVHLGAKVLRVDASGTPVGEPLPVPEAQMALRRPDGHLLVAATKFWAEFDEAGKELWRRPGRYAVAILRQ